MIEFQNKELKKRTRCIKLFPNRESLLRIATALLIELDETWLSESKRYIWGAAGILENLQKICYVAKISETDKEKLLEKQPQLAKYFKNAVKKVDNNQPKLFW